jgi:hypothetical protein
MAFAWLMMVGVTFPICLMGAHAMMGWHIQFRTNARRVIVQEQWTIVSSIMSHAKNFRTPACSMAHAILPPENASISDDPMAHIAMTVANSL